MKTLELFCKGCYGDLGTKVTVAGFSFIKRTYAHIIDI